jgi:putative SOS response-associated peptidase YedK
MCGRFTLTTPAELVAEAFGLDAVPALAPRYNVAPSQEVAVVRALPEGGRVLEQFRWGFRTGRGLVINARAESAPTRPAFRDALARRRCLLPADGFFEWKTGPGGRKTPYLVRLREGGLFALAGLWEPAAEAAGGASCVILTTEPNDVVREIHGRMPVIVGPADYGRWLDPALADPWRLQPLLEPAASDRMTAHAVSPLVNDAANESPDCLLPA